MKIIELSCTTDKNGNLRIPKRILREMDIRPGNQVKLAYLSESRSSNTYGEFMITPDGLTASLDEYGQEVNGLEIPTELLDAAGISNESDISIACGNGQIVIRDAGLCESPTELKKLFDNSAVTPDKAKVINDGGKQGE